MEATLKPKRFQFMPKTAICNVFVTQMCWEAVTNTFCGSIKADVGLPPSTYWHMAIGCGCAGVAQRSFDYAMMME